MAKAIAFDPSALGAGLHPALDLGLCGCTPQARTSAQRVIARSLAGRIAADGEDAWLGSTLTGDGYPIEFAVATLDPQLRFSCEPGGRKLTPAARFQLASALAEQLGGAALPADILAAMRWSQRDVRLVYGAWLGARISSAGSVTTKLYVELAPDRCPPLLGEWLPHLPSRSIQPRMLGIDGSGHCEIYGRADSLLPVELAALLAPAGMAERADEVLTLLAENYGAPFRGRLPGHSVGISYAPGDVGCSVTFYFFARALWGGDARIRQRFAALIPNPGQRQAYISATAPLARHNGWATRHGLVGLVLRPGLPPSWVIGFRPQSAS